MQDIVRLQPTPNALKVILKNTHFRDGVLSDGGKIKFRVDFTHALPVLIFKFPEPFYDFIQILTAAVLAGTGAAWLDKYPAVITVVISDTIITDQLSSLNFQLRREESDHMKRHMALVADLLPNQVRELEETIYANRNLLTW